MWVHVYISISLNRILLSFKKNKIYLFKKVNYELFNDIE